MFNFTNAIRIKKATMVPRLLFRMSVDLAIGHGTRFSILIEDGTGFSLQVHILPTVLRSTYIHPEI